MAIHPSDYTFFGGQTGERLGSSVGTTLSFSGELFGNDLDSDGWGDIAIGGPGRTFAGRENAGVVHFFTTVELLEDTTDLANAAIPDLLNYRQIGGSNALDRTARSIYSGSIEGVLSLFIGVPNGLALGSRGGALYQITWNELNPAAPWLDLRQSASYQFKLAGNEAGDSLGTAVVCSDEILLVGAAGLDYLDRIRAGGVIALRCEQVIDGTFALNEIGNSCIIHYGGEPSVGMGSAITFFDMDSDDLLDIFSGGQKYGLFQGAAYALREGLPFAFSFRPRPGDTGILSSDSVRFKAMDLDYGLDPSSLRLKIDNTFYNSNHPGVSYESEDGIFSFTVEPEFEFPIEVPITVFMTIRDLLGNRSPLYSYQFETGLDDRAPQLVDLSPYPGEVGVAVTRDVTFTIIDAGEGIDDNSITVQVDGVLYEYGDEEMTLTGTQNNHRVILNLPEDFPPDERIDVLINAQDIAEPQPNIMSPFSYYFITALDTVNPAVISIIPAPNSTIDVSTEFLIQLFDEGTAVDSSATTLTREQESVENAPLTFISLGDIMLLRHTPGDDLYNPGPLTLSLNSQDRSSPPNVMGTHNWNFNVVEDSLPPVLISSSPAPDSAGAARNATILVTVEDNAAGIDSSSLSLEVDGELIFHRNMIWTPISHLGYALRYPKTEGVYGDSVRIRLIANDRSSPARTLDTSWVFTTSLDEDSPYFLMIDPSDGAIGVSVQDSLVWEVADGFTGINPFSPLLIINDENYTDFIQPSSIPLTEGADWRFTFRPPSPFAYEDTLDIRFSVNDAEEPPNTAVEVYRIFTQPDEDPPYLVSPSPYPGQTAVSRGADILFELRDDGVGVSLDSLRLFVNSDLVPNGELYVQPQDGGGYSVSYNPEGLFEYSSTVHVGIWVYDLAATPNFMSEEFSFVTLSDDREPPFLSDVSPSDGTNGWPRDGEISFKLLDDGEGVDSSFTSIERVLYPNWGFTETVISVLGGYQYTLKPEILFTYSDTVTIAVNGRDLSQPANFHALPETFSFSIIRDQDPPIFTDFRPLPDSSTTVNQPFEFTVMDELAGVDTFSVHLIVNDENVSSLSEYYPVPGGIRFSYKPEDDWELGSDIQIHLEADDYSHERNIGILDYVITVAPDTDPPFVNIDSLYPPPGADDISIDTTLHILVEDDGIGVDPDQISLRIMDQEFRSSKVEAPLQRGFRFAIPLTDIGLFPGQDVEVRIEATDIAENSNEMDQFSFTFTLSPPDEELAAIPSTFTPNNDGVWDEVLIYHQGSTSTSVRLFDRRGRGVATLSGNPARWDGRDSKGEPLPSGLYIFQLEADGKTRQGTVVLAR